MPGCLLRRIRAKLTAAVGLPPQYILETEQVDTVLHFAAQTHVDNSFGNSLAFTINNTCAPQKCWLAVRDGRCLPSPSLAPACVCLRAPVPLMCSRVCCSDCPGSTASALPPCPPQVWHACAAGGVPCVPPHPPLHLRVNR